jgi:ATP-dependent helicase/nuclease subunit B
LLLALADAAAQGFAPLPLLTLLKHPLVMAERRGEWLEGARLLDRALRGPRPAPGLAGSTGISPSRTDATGICAARRGALVARGAGAAGAAGGGVRGRGAAGAGLLAALRETAQALGGDALWARAEGREAANLLDDPPSARPPTARRVPSPRRWRRCCAR